MHSVFNFLNGDIERASSSSELKETIATVGRIDMQQDAGGYEIRPSADNRVRIATDERIGEGIMPAATPSR